MKPFGTILLLNGASSSGKTTLLEALQDALEAPYLNAGIDKFIWMLPDRYLDRPLWDDVLGRAVEAGEMGQRLFSGMHHAIAALSRAGLNVVADHVLVEAAWIAECVELFAGLPVYWIGVQCPLEVLEQRERARKNRTLGQARAQFECVHAAVTATLGGYDLEVDTSLLAPDACARLIADHIQREPAKTTSGARGQPTGSPFAILEPAYGLAERCAPILRALPEWFGLESALQQYISDIARYPTFLAVLKTAGALDVPAGFLTLKLHSPDAAEIYVMGVRPELHRQGLGRELVRHAEASLRQQGVQYLQVKTLSSTHPDPSYAHTRAFYHKMDFRPLEEMPTLWGPENPCLILIKSLFEDGT